MLLLRSLFALASFLWGATETSSTASDSALIAPVPLEAIAVNLPADHPHITEELRVLARLEIDEAGEVVRVEIIEGAGPPFDEAVLIALARARFHPALHLGEPVPVAINFTQRFLPDPEISKTESVADDDRDAALVGRLRERGTRQPIGAATVIASVAGRSFETTSDDKGNFRLALPAGTATVTVSSAGHRAYLQIERIAPHEELSVGYGLELEKRSPYEIVVTTKLDRTDVARTKLRGREISQIPGTFGDPFRVIGTLPGVSSMMSLLPFPIVRGSSPGNTGFLIDGVRVPLLFHLLAGPSVIHPEFIDAIEFSPGGFPAEYGGYTGGIVDGKTRSAGRGEEKIDFDLNMFQVGGLVREPLPFIGGTGTIAARYGFPGFLVSLASPRISLSYWDYQARFDGGSANNGFTIFVFGASDALDAVPDGKPDTDPKEPRLHARFHRVDLRYHRRDGEVDSQYQLTLGSDASLSPDADLSGLSATPRIRWATAVSPELDLRLGIDGFIKHADLTAGTNGLGDLGLLIGVGGEPSKMLIAGGVLLEALFHPIPELLIRPGVRYDGYDDTLHRHSAIDPRLLARYRILEAAPELWLKGSVGIYHQPPRFTIPVPGLDEIAFQKGLLESTQFMIGADVVFDQEWSLDAQTYFNQMDPILYDTQINPSADDILKLGPQAPPGEAPPTPPRSTRRIDERLDQLLVPAIGRSYGIELLLRRRSTSGVSGWISYTLSRSERLHDTTWNGFDFDRTHILNVVLSVPLPRQWQIGARAQLQSGRPLTTTAGLASARTSDFVRFDLRVDKTAIWNDWLLDFYVDVSNVVLGEEELTPQTQLRYVLPTLGFRAIF